MEPMTPEERAAKIAEIRRQCQELPELMRDAKLLLDYFDEHILQFRSIEATLGTLDHSPAIDDETVLPGHVSTKAARSVGTLKAECDQLAGEVERLTNIINPGDQIQRCVPCAGTGHTEYGFKDCQLCKGHGFVMTRWSDVVNNLEHQLAEHAALWGKLRGEVRAKWFRKDLHPEYSRGLNEVLALIDSLSPAPKPEAVLCECKDCSRCKGWSVYGGDICDLCENTGIDNGDCGVHPNLKHSQPPQRQTESKQEKA